jgi:hypothetical protein
VVPQNPPTLKVTALWRDICEMQRSMLGSFQHFSCRHKIGQMDRFCVTWAGHGLFHVPVKVMECLMEHNFSTKE